MSRSPLPAADFFLVQEGEETFLSLARTPAFSEYLGQARFLSDQDLRALYALSVISLRQVESFTEQQLVACDEPVGAVKEWEPQGRPNSLELTGSSLPVSGK